MKNLFSIQPKKALNSFIKEGKFYAKNESSRILNFGEKDPMASCYGISMEKQAEKSLAL
ncbi:hypothetical protein [Runella sp.]|uniref:hypothetical protein n=1 Tax=Runella sp. TaxID=1960881 RepID=UPI003D09C986